MAQPFGLVADDGTKDDPAQKVNVFDLETNEVVASIPVGPGLVVGDVAITPDQTLGFATDFNHWVWVIDLTTSPPSLATGVNPIRVSLSSEDVTVTPDGRFLLVTNGGGEELSNTPLSVVDIAARAEVDTFFTGKDTIANDACDDGSSVLIASRNGSNVRRVTLGADGSVTDTEEVLHVAGALNVYCAPGSGSGVVVSNDGGVRSFTVPGLALVDTRNVTDPVVSAVFSPSGDRVFVRIGDPVGSVEVFDFDPATGAFGDAPPDSLPVEITNLTFGIDRLAMSSGGDALYVPERAPVFAVSVFDPATLTLLDRITGPDISGPTGIAVAQVAAFATFEAFDAVLELDDDDLDDDDEHGLELEGEFTLGAASDGIDPLAEDVSLTVGSLSVTIPAGSFKFNARKQAFEFEGRIGGNELEIEIGLLMDGTYGVEAEFEGADRSDLVEPVSVILTIGDDGGETIAAVKFDD